MADPFTYIRSGEILKGKDGIFAKLNTKASAMIDRLKGSLNVDKDTRVEEVPDELINNLVSAFKDGALKFKPGLKTTRDHSDFKTTSNQSTNTAHSREGNRNVTTTDSTQEGSATWKDGGHATFTLGGDPIVDGGAGAYIDANYKISSTKNEKESDPNCNGFNYRGVDVNKSAVGNVKTGGHFEVCDRRSELHIEAHGEATCGYSHSKEDGTIQTQATDGHKLMNTTESKYERSAGARAGASGRVSLKDNSINVGASARADAGCSVSSKKIQGESMPNIDGYEYESTETEYAAAAHGNLDANVHASANIMDRKAGVNLTGGLKSHGKANFKHVNCKEKWSTPKETKENRVFHKVRAEADGGFEGNLNASGFIGDKSKKFGASVKGKTSGMVECTPAEWSYTKNKDGFTGRFEALSAEAEGQSELTASVNTSNGQKSFKMMADGRIAAKAVDVKADLTVKKDANKTSIGGIHANIGHFSARGKAGIQLPGQDEKSVQAEFETNLASVNALQAEVREKETCDEADIHVKTGLVSANVGNAKIVGKRTGKKSTITKDSTLAELNAGNVSVTGIDNRESNRARVNARLKNTATANIGNVDITGLGSRETRFEANTAPGVDAFNFRAGIHRNTGGSVSTNRASFCNVDLSIGPPNWNLAVGHNIGNIGIPFFGGGGSSEGGRSSGAHPNQTNGEEEDDDNRNKTNRGDGGSGGNGNDGNGTGGSGTGRGGNGTGGNSTGQGGNGTGGNSTGRGGNGTGGNSTGHGGNGTGRDGNDTGESGNGTGYGGNGYGGNGTGVGGNGTGGNGSGTGGNGYGPGGNGTGGNVTGRGGNRTARGGNGSDTGGNGTGRGGNGTGYGENGTGRGGNGTGYGENGTGGHYTGRGGNGTGRGGNGIGRGGNGTGGGGNGTGRGGNVTGRGGNSTGRGGNVTGRGGNSTGRAGNVTGRGGNGTGRGGNGTGRNGQSGPSQDGQSGISRNGRNGLVDDNGSKKINIEDTADQNRLMAELVAQSLPKPRGNPRRSAMNHDSGLMPFDWGNSEKVEEHLFKTYNPNEFLNSKQSSSSQFGSTNTRKSKPQRKQPPPKPSGSNKNIHTIFTIGAGDSKPIQKLGNNIYGFGNDD